MRTNADRNWELIGNMLSAESSGKSPRLFSSRRTLFGIPSALDQELEALSDEAARAAQEALEDEAARAVQEARAGGSAEEGARATTRAASTNDRSVPTTRNKKSTRHPTTVCHPLEPVFDEHSRVLILGTMPSPKSRETGFYYNHPQNRFWKVMAALFEEPVPETNDEKRALVLRHNIALWDVLAECTIEGASDGSIADCVPNNIGLILAKAPIEAIFCTGAKATELYAKYCEPHTHVAATRLPSTSPANAAVSLEQLIEAYQPIRKETEGRS